jgi:Rrf2 family protein
MKITTKTRYGLRALIYIARNAPKDGEALIRIKDISETQKISVQYLEQILYKLKEAGVILGKRGPNGGYTMLKRPDEISVGEIFRILESDIKIAVCDPAKDICVGEDCTTSYLWGKLNGALEEVLMSTTLQEIIDEFTAKKKAREEKGSGNE